MRKRLAFVGTVLLSVGCPGKRQVPVDPTVPAAPATSAPNATPGETRPDPAGSSEQSGVIIVQPELLPLLNDAILAIEHVL